jgi:hypothetical protein
LKGEENGILVGKNKRKKQPEIVQVQIRKLNKNSIPYQAGFYKDEPEEEKLIWTFGSINEAYHENEVELIEKVKPMEK